VDAPVLAALLGELGYPTDAAAVEARLRPLLGEDWSAVFVAEEDGRALGFSACLSLPLIHRDAPTCRLAALVVADGARSQGIGAALVERVEASARRWGCDRIEVTSGNDRPDAQRFYLREGFSPKPERFVKTLEYV
jgi:GNAT superfamily N-acetyltransferase